MGKLSTGTIKALQPIAEAIDVELEKEQPNRVNFMIRCAAPSTMKSNLVLYKTLLRRDWNGKFWMTKKEEGVEINFTPNRVANFTLQPIVKLDPEPNFTIVASATVEPAILHEMTDAEASHHLLVENPSALLLNISYLTPETKAYLDDPNNADQSAFIRLLQRRGYSWTIIGNKLKVHL